MMVKLHCQIIILLSIVSLGCKQQAKFDRLPGNHEGGTDRKTLDEEERRKAETAELKQILEKEIEAGLIDRIPTDLSCREETSSSPSLRPLTRGEYTLTANAALGIQLPETFASLLPQDSIIHGHRNFSDLNKITASRLTTFLAASEFAAAQLLSQKPETYNCGQPEASCVDAWIKAKVPLLWRKAVSSSELERLNAFFSENGGNQQAFGLLIARVLLSPNFLFRKEIGNAEGLDSYEIASALAFTLWGQGPDGGLLEQASRNAFTSKEAIKNQAAQMIADQRFDIGLRRFIETWLETDRIHRSNNSEEAYPGYSADIKENIANDVFLVLRNLIDKQEDSFKNLFTVDYTFSDKTADFYGLGKHNQEPAYRGVEALELPAGATGILSLPGLVAGLSLNANTSIPIRGTFVLSKLLCKELPTPSAEILEEAGNLLPDPNLSARESFAKQTSGANCVTCHVSINGIGFGMENISPVGVVRDIDDHGKPVDASATFLTHAGKEIPYNGIGELNEIISRSERAQQCMTTHIFRYALGREETSTDSCTISKARVWAYEGGLRFTDILGNILTSSLYLNRK